MDSPFPARENPAVERIRAHLAEWVATWSLVRTEAARRRFDLADFGWFASVTYPTASPAHAELTADWFGWLFLVDDQLDDGTFGRDPAQARQCLAELTALLTHRPVATASPAALALADLWARTSAGMASRWRRRFVRHVTDCFEAAAVWEAGNRVRGIVPDEATYVRRRRDTGAIYVCMDLIDVVERLDVPDAIYHSGPFRAALDAACNVVCWTNDLYSFDKEHALGEVHNLVSVVAHHQRLSDEDAAGQVAARIDRETTRYLELEAVVRTAHRDAGDVIEPYLAGMRSWMRGNLDWSSRTRRYRDQITGADYLEPLMNTGAVG